MSNGRIILGVLAVVFCAGAGVCFGEPVIVVEPNELNFVALEGGSNPDAQILYISNGGTGKLKWEITEDCEWLSLEPLSGSFVDEIDEVTVSADITGLSSGEYSCGLLITDPDAENSPQIVIINLNVIGSTLEVSPSEFVLFALEGGSNPESQVLTIGNGGGEVLNWEIESSGSCDWLSIGSMSGSLGLGEDEDVILDFYITGLKVGEYNCGLTIRDEDELNNTQDVMVSLYIIYDDGILNVPSEIFTIQDAVEVAKDGHEIIVADGTYTGEGNCDIDFLGKKLTIRSENGPENCIIDCSKIEISDPNHRGFMFISGEDENSVLDGFTVTNGEGNLEDPDGDGVYYSLGGAVYCYKSGPTIRNCIFRNNWANYGGGIGCYESEPIITGCSFVENLAESGCGGGGLYGCNGMISNCNISRNTVLRYSGSGGGLYNCDGIIINCTISDNTASSGGGMVFCDGTISNSQISGNAAISGSGGGFAYCNGTISNCKISGNTVIYSGGGLYRCHGTISNCIIIDNVTIHHDGAGLSRCDGMVRNCTIANNTSGYRGGGLESCGGEIVNCTITGNAARVYGGGIYSYYYDSTVVNCILWGNEPQEIYVYSGVPSVAYCNVEGGWEGIDNINVDPEFVDATDDYWVDGDYHLRWDSPCIDAGQPNFLAGEGEVDIDGEPRVMGGRVDMGADEVGEKQADFTRDGRIDLSDMAVLSGAWETQEGELRWCVLSDLFEDGVIGLDDLAMFVDDWMWVAEWAQ